MSEQVCTVVVTHNRKRLLLECLDAILSQTQPVTQILIIDNASTDGTSELLQAKGYLDRSVIEYVCQTANVGGAGGFHEGMKRAYENGFTWIWVMDDDAIPEPDALNRLLAAHHRFDEVQQPRLLASKVIWVDGSLHPMNAPQIKTSNLESLFLATQHSTMSIRYATFVSLLVHRSLIEQYGLPIADYFVWADDIEYTARILRNELGIIVPDSLVWHKTAKKHTRMDDAGPRYYYHVRNNIWMLTHSNSWSRKEKMKKAVYLLREIPSYLILSHFTWQSIWAVVLGLKDGFFKVPKT